MLSYFYKEKDHKLILCKITSLLLTVTLVCHFLIPSQAFAKNKFEKRIPVSININTKWDYMQGNHRVVGYYKSNIRGAANLIEEKGEFLRYFSESLTTSYEFKEDHIEMSKSDPCFGKIVEERFGSGGAKLKNFILDIFLGQTGKFTWVASQRRAPTPEELKIPKDVYQVTMAAEGKFTAKRKSDKGCEPANPISGTFPVGFTVGVAEIKPGGLTGNYAWQGDIRYRDEKVILMVPSPTPSRAPHYQVSWTFGGPKPVECSLKAVCGNAQHWYECASRQISNIFGLIAQAQGIATAENSTYQARGLPEFPGYNQLIAAFLSLEQRIVTFQTNVFINQAQSQGECEQLPGSEDKKECQRVAKSVEEALKKTQETLKRDIETEITKFEGSTMAAAGSAARSTALAGLQATLALLKSCQ